MKYKTTILQAALLLTPMGVFAQAQQPCLGGALGISTNCSGSISGSAALSPLTPATSRSTVGSVGNPVSVSSFAIDSLFNNAAYTPIATTTETSKGGNAAVKDTVSAGNRSAMEAGGALSYFDIDGLAVRRIGLPLSYSIQPDIDPREKLTFRLPITRTTWGANQSATSIGLGVDYRLPITDEWSVVPAVSYTHSDGDEFNGKAAIWAMGATSVYNMDLGESSLSIANMLGYSSIRNNSNSTTSNNAVLRNGVMWARPVELFEEKVGMQLFLSHTHYMSSDVAIKNYVEAGVNLSSGKSVFSAKDYWRAGLSFTKSDNTKGVSFNIGYWF